MTRRRQWGGGITRRQQKQRRKNMIRAVSEVKYVMAHDFTFMEASRMVISRFVIHHLDDEMGDEGLRLDREVDLESVIQELIRAVFATRNGAIT